MQTTVEPPTSVTPTEPRLRDDRPGRGALLVVGIMTVLSVVRAFTPLTYPGDIWRQSDTASIARNFAENGMALFYPQIDWGGAGPGYVEAEFQLMPWLTAALYQVFGEHEWLGRLVSLAFMLVATAAFWGLARRVLPPVPARWALIAFAASPAFMRWGTAFMPEATVMAFTVLTLYAFCRWIQEDRGLWLAASAAAMSMAGLVKPTSLHTGLVLAIWVALAAPARLRRPWVYLAGLAALVAPALWLRHAANLHAEYGNTFGVLSGGDSKFGSLELWSSPGFYLGNLRSEVLFVYGVVGVVFALAGAWWVWRHRRTTPAFALLVAGLAALTVYYLAAGRYTGSDLGIQYHVYSMTYAALLIGAGVAPVLNRVRQRVSVPAATALSALVAVLLAAQAGYVLARSFGDQSGVLGTCADQLSRVSQPDDLVVVGTTSTTTEDGVPNNFQEPVILYRADRKGWVLAADQYEHPLLLESYHNAGAHYFVNPDPALIPTGSPLAAWLATNSTRVTTAAAEGCDIYDLGPKHTP